MSSQLRDTLEEVTTDSLPREHIVRRVDDWERRINQLYDRITGWLPPGFSADRSQTVEMREELMEKAGVDSRSLPVLRILRSNREVLTLQPYGLWIIGANGRIKAYGAKGFAHIVDRAENFQPPNWEIAVGSDRHKTRPLGKDDFLVLL